MAKLPVTRCAAAEELWRILNQATSVSYEEGWSKSGRFLMGCPYLTMGMSHHLQRQLVSSALMGSSEN